MLQFAKKRIFAVALVILGVVAILVSIQFYRSNGNKKEYDALQEAHINSDMEYGTFHSVSEGGSTIYAYNSISDEVIEGAKNYIKEKGYDNKGLYFVFLNSPSTFGPDYVTENILDYYDPEEAITECSTESSDQMFYVEENYGMLLIANFVYALMGFLWER